MQWICPECGTNYDDIQPDNLPDRLRAIPRDFRAVIGPADDALIRRRPEPTVWSALEYAGHTGYVFRSLGAAVRAMVDGTPLPESEDNDEEVVQSEYNQRPVDDVLDQLGGSSEDFLGVVSAFTADDWGKTAELPWGTRDVLTMAQNAVHEGAHHLMDARRVLERVAE